MTDVPETRYVRSGDVEIAVQVCDGEGPDIVLASHAQVPIDTMWDDPLLARGLRRLGAAGRLITCDLRGWGSSEQIFGPVPAMQAWMDDIEAVMDAARSSQAAIVAPAAIGAAAMLFAATHPERVSSLVTVGSFARYERDDDYEFGMPTTTLDDGIRWFCASIGRGPTIDLMAPSRADDPLFRRWALRSERLSLGPGDAQRAALVDLFMRADVRGVLPNVLAPCLIVHRAGDAFVVVDHARYLESHLPNAKLVGFPESDHLWSSGDVEGIFEAIAAFVSGARRNGAPRHRALATILFTDIVGSTERAEALGDREWRLTLERYEALAARHVESFRGRLVKSTGDGTLAVFDGPARAIECACELRDASAAAGLPLRSGLHTGEVELVGDDVAGIAVHVAARVMALAAPDEVVVSSSVPPLVAGSGIAFHHRGTHELKGVGEPWQIFAVGP